MYNSHTCMYVYTHKREAKKLKPGSYFTHTTMHNYVHHFFVKADDDGVMTQYGFNLEITHTIKYAVRKRRENSMI